MEELPDDRPVQATDLDAPPTKRVTDRTVRGSANGHNGQSQSMAAVAAVPLDIAATVAAGPGRADTWGSNLPALRLAARADAHHEGPRPVSAPTQSESVPARAPAQVPAPSSLRATRGIVGVLLLLAGWAATTACFWLGQLVFAGFPQVHEVAPRIGLYVGTALGALWVGVVALACVIAGAFALSLAIRSRGW